MWRRAWSKRVRCRPPQHPTPRLAGWLGAGSRPVQPVPLNALRGCAAGSALGSTETQRLQELAEEVSMRSSSCRPGHDPSCASCCPLPAARLLCLCRPCAPLTPCPTPQIAAMRDTRHADSGGSSTLQPGRLVTLYSKLHRLAPSTPWRYHQGQQPEHSAQQLLYQPHASLPQPSSTAAHGSSLPQVSCAALALGATCGHSSTLPVAGRGLL
jgi:hypothetical protein